MHSEELRRPVQDESSVRIPDGYPEETMIRYEQYPESVYIEMKMMITV